MILLCRKIMCYVGAAALALAGRDEALDRWLGRTE